MPKKLIVGDKKSQFVYSVTKICYVLSPLIHYLSAVVLMFLVFVSKIIICGISKV